MPRRDVSQNQQEVSLLLLESLHGKQIIARNVDSEAVLSLKAKAVKLTWPEATISPGDPEPAGQDTASSQGQFTFFGPKLWNI